jgi:anti-anti-sigma factor
MTTQSAHSDANTMTRQGPIEHPCQITSDYMGQTRLVRVDGRLDWVTASELRDLLRDHCADPEVIVDLGATTGIDASGVGILLASTARFKEKGQHLAVVVSDPFLVEVLCSTGLPTVVPVVASEAEAFRRLHADETT